MRTVLALLFAFTLSTPAPSTAGSALPEPPPGPGSQAFSKAWYAGTAEITSYRLEQARYGEIHSGEAVAIFVTEDFSRSKQVKLDRPGTAGSDRVGVMKLNLTKSFPTGVYPYSMMTSVFSPTDPAAGDHPLKITTSSQEWCGHTFMQLNRTDVGYRAEIRSYFESEGDEELELSAPWTEDGLWTLLRIDPTRLPIGELEILPSTFFLRLKHVATEPHRATATLEADPDHEDLLIYRLSYPGLRRDLRIHFRRSFPYEIEAWEETTISGWGASAKNLTTRATALERKHLDYWNRNGVADLPLRRELGLTTPGE